MTRPEHRPQWSGVVQSLLDAVVRLPKDIAELLAAFADGPEYMWIPCTTTCSAALKAPWTQFGPQPADSYGTDHYAVAVPALAQDARHSIDMDFLLLSTFLPCARLAIVSGSKLQQACHCQLGSAEAIAERRSLESHAAPEAAAQETTSPPKEFVLGGGQPSSMSGLDPLAVVSWSNSGETVSLRGRGFQPDKALVANGESANPFRCRLTLDVDVANGNLHVQVEDVDDPTVTADLRGVVQIKQDDVKDGLWLVALVTWGTAIRFCDAKHEVTPRDEVQAEVSSVATDKSADDSELAAHDEDV